MPAFLKRKKMIRRKTMRQNLSHIDSAFTNKYKSLLETQRSIAGQLKQYPFDLEKREITQAVYERMMAFWYFNVNNCKELGREVNTVAADFFTETCLFFLKPYFEQRRLEIASEMDIRKDKASSNVIRPDLSIWKEEKLIAIIELKVNDGWKGKTMNDHLDNRKKEIQEIWPGVFFGAISFWNCFDKDLRTKDSEYIGLYEYAKDNNHQPTKKTIEQILKRIVDLVP